MMREECKNLKGRKRDLCEGRGLQGRQNPLQSASDDLRRSMGLGPIVVEEPQARQIIPQSSQRKAVSQIGSRLTNIFTSRIGAIPCGSCKASLVELNSMTTANVRNDRDLNIDSIEANAKSATVAWWAQVLAYADNMVTGGMASRAMIGLWLDEALASEEASGAK